MKILKVFLATGVLILVAGVSGCTNQSNTFGLGETNNNSFQNINNQSVTDVENAAKPTSEIAQPLEKAPDTNLIKPLTRAFPTDQFGKEVWTMSKTLPRERGMVGIQVLDSTTKQGIPEASFNVSYSSEMKTADALGYVEFPETYTDVYVSPRSNYKSSGTIHIPDYKDVQVITVYLDPESVPNGYTLVYQYGSSFKTTTGETILLGTIKGKITNEVKPNVSVAIVGTSLSAVTDADGKFQIKLPGSSETYRLYLPNETPKNYYQFPVTAGIQLTLNPIKIDEKLQIPPDIN